MNRTPANARIKTHWHETAAPTKRIRRIGSVFLLLLSASATAGATPTIKSAACVVEKPPAADSVGATSQGSYEQVTCKLDGRLRIELDGVPATATSADIARYVLVLDQRTISGLAPIVWTPPWAPGEPTQLWFDLRRDRDDAAASLAWNSILSRSLLGRLPAYRPEPTKADGGAKDQTEGVTGATDAVAMSVGLRLASGEVVFAPKPIPFDARPTRQLIAAGVVFAALLVAVFWLAGRSDILRDAGPQPRGEGERRPFSLARTQMAWWFFVVLGAFLFIWIVTGDDTKLSDQALALMGISAVTGLAATAVDADARRTEGTAARTRVERAREQITALEAAPATAERDATLAKARLELVAAEAEASGSLHGSKGFLTDVLSDDDGVSFHRLQMLTWTLVAGAVFLATVVASLAMPGLNPTLLVLMGISSGTYLGFKLPITK